MNEKTGFIYLLLYGAWIWDMALFVINYQKNVFGTNCSYNNLLKINFQWTTQLERMGKGVGFVFV